MTHHLRLLGAPGLFDQTGTPVQLRTRKQLGVLVVLLLEAQGQGISRDVLVEYFWPGVTEKKGRHSLAQALTAIRGELGTESVETDGPFIRLTEPMTSDLDRPFPNGNNGTEGGQPTVPLLEMEQLGGIELSHWVDAARTRVLRTARKTLVNEMETLRSKGSHQAVQERAERLYQIDPGNHAAVHVLAEHAAESGDKVGAVELLEDFLAYSKKHHRDRKTGTITRLLARIQSGEFNTVRPKETDSTPRFTPVFVGRAEELQAMQEIWRSLRETPTRTLLVSGESGVGKTALVNKFAHFIGADGHLVLRATCQPVAREIPFATVTSLIEDLSDDRELGATDPHWLSEASRIAPSLRTRFSGVPEPQPYPGETIRLTIAEAFHQVVKTVAVEGRVCIILDNVESLDPASRDVLTVLARRPREYGAMIIGTIRSELANDRSGEGASFANDLEWTHKTVLGPLKESHMDQLLRSAALNNRKDQTENPPFETIKALSAGSPHYAELLLQDWKLQGNQSLASTVDSRGGNTGWQPPSSVHATFQRRHRRQNRSTRMLLEMLAVANDPTDVSVLAAISGESCATVSNIVRDCIEAGSIAMVSGKPTLRSRAHAAFIYSGLDDDRRHLIHAEFADHYSSEPSGESQAKSIPHLVQTKQETRAVDAAVLAAKTALKKGGPREADQLLSQFVRGNRRGADFHLLLGRAKLEQGLFEEATEAVETVRTGSPYECQALLIKTEAKMRRPNVPMESAAGDLKKAVQLAEVREHPDLFGAALLLQAEYSVGTRDIVQLGLVSERIRGLEEGPGDYWDPRVGLSRAFCVLNEAKFMDAFSYFTRVDAAAAKIGDTMTSTKALNGSGICAHAMGEFRVAIDHLENAFGNALRLGDHGQAANIAGNLMVVHADFGDLDDADRWRVQAEDQLTVSSPDRKTLSLLANVTDFYLQTEQRRAIRQSVKELRLAFDGARARDQMSVLHVEADVFIQQGDTDLAIQAINRADTIGGYSRARRLLGSEPSSTHRLLRFRDFVEGRPLRLEDWSIDRISVAAFLEWTAVDEWIGRKNHDKERGDFSRLVAATGMTGIGDRMRTLGFCSS